MSFGEIALLWGLIGFPIATIYYAYFETPEARAKRWRNDFSNNPTLRFLS